MWSWKELRIIVEKVYSYNNLFTRFQCCKEKVSKKAGRNKNSGSSFWMIFRTIP